MALVPKLPDLVPKKSHDDQQLFLKICDNENKNVKYSCKNATIWFQVFKIFYLSQKAC